jgi:hypothetical protein
MFQAPRAIYTPKREALPEIEEVPLQLTDSERLVAARTERALAKRSQQDEQHLENPGGTVQEEKKPAGSVGRPKGKVTGKAKSSAVQPERSSAVQTSSAAAALATEASRATRGSAGTYAGRRPPRSEDGQRRLALIAKLGAENKIPSKHADAFYRYMMHGLLDDLSNAADIATVFMPDSPGVAASSIPKRKAPAVPAVPAGSEEAAPVVRVRPISPKSEQRCAFMREKLSEGYSMKEANELYRELPAQVLAKKLKMEAEERKTVARAKKLETAAKFKERSLKLQKKAKKQQEIAQLPEQDQCELLPTPASSSSVPAVKLSSKEGEEGEEEENIEQDEEVEIHDDASEVSEAGEKAEAEDAVESTGEIVEEEDMVNAESAPESTEPGASTGSVQAESQAKANAKGKAKAKANPKTKAKAGAKAKAKAKANPKAKAKAGAKSKAKVKATPKAAPKSKAKAKASKVK